MNNILAISKLKNISAYIVTIVILLGIFYWLDKESLRLLLKTNVIAVTVSVGFAFIIYFTSGIQYYLIRKQFGVSLSLTDIFLLPIVGNLWSFLIPFQGNLLFTTAFFKSKYNMKVSESFSISVYMYLVVISITGMFGLLFIVFNKQIISWFSLISLIFLLNPFFLYLLNRIFSKIKPRNNKIILAFQNFISKVVKNTQMLWQNLSFSITIACINLFRVFLSIFWFYWISQTLDFNFTFLAIALLSLVMSVSIIIKFTPDNLGISQIIAGGLMGYLGISSQQAILITLFASGTTMLIIFTVGVIGNFYYFKTIKLGTLIKQMRKPAK